MLRYALAHMWGWSVSVLVLVFLIGFVGESRSQESTATVGAKKHFIVATKEAPPFAMVGPDGKWTGISIELWNAIAQDPALNIETEFVDAQTVPRLIGMIKNGQAQAGIAAITVNETRERDVDFTFPYYNAGLAMAVVQQDARGVLSKVVWDIVKKGLFPLLVAFTIAGVFIWLLEFRCNSTHFGGGLLRGIGSGIWWAVVTVAAGYGDKYPTGCIGRLFGMLWMLAGIILLTLFTGIVTTSLTVTTLEGTDIKPEELRKYKVGFIRQTTSADYVTTVAQCVEKKEFSGVAQGLQALRDKAIEVFVHDQPILEYSVKNYDSKARLKVLPATFSPQSYSIALPQDSPYRETINRLVERQANDPTWQTRVQSYLGK